MEPKLLFTVREVARATGQGDSTVRRQIELKQLKVVRIGRSVRVRPEDLQAFIDARVEA